MLLLLFLERIGLAVLHVSSWWTHTNTLFIVHLVVVFFVLFFLSSFIWILNTFLCVVCFWLNCYAFLLLYRCSTKLMSFKTRRKQSENIYEQWNEDATNDNNDWWRLNGIVKPPVSVFVHDRSIEQTYEMHTFHEIMPAENHHTNTHIHTHDHQTKEKKNPTNIQTIFHLIWFGSAFYTLLLLKISCKSYWDGRHRFSPRNDLKVER